MNSRACLREMSECRVRAVAAAFGVAAAGQRADPSVDFVIEHVAADFPGHVTLAGDGPVAVGEALGRIVVVGLRAASAAPGVR